MKLVLLLVALSVAGFAAGAALAAPAAAELAFQRGGWIYLGRADGTVVRRLVRGAGPSWSPDGTQLVYSDRDRLYVVGADGRGRRLLARSGFGAAWSADGRRIAFVSRRTGRPEIHVIGADGRNARRVTRRTAGWQEAYSPAWSPDGRLLAFSSTRAGFFNPEIYVIRPDGSGLRRLTFTKGSDGVLGDDGMPHWSSDGTRIAFTSNRTQSGGVWVMRPDGRGQRRLYDAPGTDDWTPRFSPDGTRIAFTRVFPAGKSELWIMGADGRNPRRLGPGSDVAWRPTAASGPGSRRSR
jgi:TolB protein